MSPPLLIQAVDLARSVMRRNKEHIHLSQAETELLAYGILKQYSPADAHVKNMDDRNSGLIAIGKIEKPPLGPVPRCTCGHLVSEHYQHDPGHCTQCTICRGFELVSKVPSDDPHDYVSGQPRTSKANERQIAGDHYGLSDFQHWDLVALFNLDYFQGQITKYVMRWKKKNGVSDLEKAAHFLEKYIELIKNKKIE